jgi:chemotaxis protein histidine kinase CheA
MKLPNIFKILLLSLLLTSIATKKFQKPLKQCKLLDTKKYIHPDSNRLINGSGEIEFTGKGRDVYIKIHSDRAANSSAAVPYGEQDANVFLFWIVINGWDNTQSRITRHDDSFVCLKPSKRPLDLDKLIKYRIVLDREEKLISVYVDDNLHFKCKDHFGWQAEEAEEFGLSRYHESKFELCSSIKVKALEGKPVQEVGEPNEEAEVEKLEERAIEEAEERKVKKEYTPLEEEDERKTEREERRAIEESKAEERRLEEEERIKEDRRAAEEERKAIEEDRRIVEEDKEIVEEDKEIVEEDKEIVEEDRKAVKKDREAVEEDKEIVEEDREAVEVDKKAVEKDREAVEEEKEVVEEEKEAVEEVKKTVEEDKEAVEEDKKAVEEDLEIVEEDKKEVEEKLEEFSEQRKADEAREEEFSRRADEAKAKALEVTEGEKSTCSGHATHHEGQGCFEPEPNKYTFSHDWILEEGVASEIRFSGYGRDVYVQINNENTENSHSNAHQYWIVINGWENRKSRITRGDDSTVCNPTVNPLDLHKKNKFRIVLDHDRREITVYVNDNEEPHFSCVDDDEDGWRAYNAKFFSISRWSHTNFKICDVQSESVIIPEDENASEDAQEVQPENQEEQSPEEGQEVMPFEISLPSHHFGPQQVGFVPHSAIQNTHIMGGASGHHPVTVIEINAGSRLGHHEASECKCQKCNPLTEILGNLAGLGGEHQVNPLEMLTQNVLGSGLLGQGHHPQIEVVSPFEGRRDSFRKYHNVHPDLSRRNSHSSQIQNHLAKFRQMMNEESVEEEQPSFNKIGDIGSFLLDNLIAK